MTIYVPNMTDTPDWFISPRILDDKRFVDAYKLVEKELLPRIPRDCLVDIHELVTLIEDFSDFSKINQETIYSCVMRDPSFKQLITAVLEQSGSHEYLHCKYLEPERREAKRRNIINEYESGQLDMTIEENKRIVVECECQRLFEYIKQGYKLAVIKNLLPDPQRYYDRRQTLKVLLQNCKEHLYNWDTSRIITFLQHSIPILRYVDSTMFLLDRLVKDIKLNCRQRDEFNQSVCNAILEEIANGNLTCDISIDKKDEQHVYLTCSIEDLNEWTPDPFECGDDPITKSSKAGHFLSILFSLFRTLSEFVRQYQLDLEKRILYQKSTCDQEIELYEKLGQMLGEEIMKPIYVMLFDWEQSKTTGILLRSIKYWPEHHSNPVNFPVDSELDGRRSAFESVLDPTISVTWIPHIEPVSLTLQFDNGVFEFIVPASALEVLKLLIERNCNDPFTLNDTLYERDIAVWRERGVITESEKGVFFINNVYNKQ